MIGGGTIGLCAVAAVTAMGCKVALVARHDHQKEAGTRLGAIEPSGEYDVAIESSGSTSGVADSCGWLRPNGKLLLLSSSWEDVRFPGLSIAAKEIEIIVSSMYCMDGVARDVDNAALLLGNNPLIGKSIIAHRFPLIAAAEAFEVARDRKAGVIKVILEP